MTSPHHTRRIDLLSLPQRPPRSAHLRPCRRRLGCLRVAGGRWRRGGGQWRSVRRPVAVGGGGIGRRLFDDRSTLLGHQANKCSARQLQYLGASNCTSERNKMFLQHLNETFYRPASAPASRSEVMMRCEGHPSYPPTRRNTDTAVGDRFRLIARQVPPSWVKIRFCLAGLPSSSAIAFGVGATSALFLFQELRHGLRLRRRAPPRTLPPKRRMKKLPRSRTLP